jgi:hypothetical protein
MAYSHNKWDNLVPKLILRLAPPCRGPIRQAPVRQAQEGPQGSLRRTKVRNQIVPLECAVTA